MNLEHLQISSHFVWASSVTDETVTWTNEDILSNEFLGPLGTNFTKICIKTHLFFFEGNIFENFDCKISVIWLNILHF